MTESMSRAERVKARDADEAARNQARREAGGSFGMTYTTDDRPSPVQLAADAFAAGHRLFQVDLPVAYVQGAAHMGSTMTRTVRGETSDLLGQIEDQGWLLEHVSTAFVQRGWGSTKRLQIVVGTSADDVATHGDLVGLYVFRRRA